MHEIFKAENSKAPLELDVESNGAPKIYTFKEGETLIDM
jgi:hypothetical protein